MLKRWFSGVIASRSTRIIVLICIGLVGSTFWRDGVAATHLIPTSISQVDCGSYGGGVRPGDVVVLKGPSRGKISFTDCKGTADQPIKIQNDRAAAEPLVIEYAGSGLQTGCTNCEHVVWDGTGKWAGAPDGICGVSVTDGYRVLGMSQCGIVFRCKSGSPHSAVRFSGSSKNFTVQGIEIDGNFPTCSAGIGLSINDHGYELADHPGEWREGIRLLHNYIHDSGTEAIYLGGNVNPDKGGAGDLPLRNNEIAFTYVDRAGCDGIQYKNAIAGLSTIHHNYVTNTGQASAGGDSGCSSAGISLLEAGYTDIYSNYVESPSPNSTGVASCIKVHVMHQPLAVTERLPVRIFNNIAHNCKGAGISSGRASETLAAPVPLIYNNTVVAPVGGSGINVGSSVQTCAVNDNIVAGEKISAPGCTTARNIVDSVDALKFRNVAARDFRLTSGSPAVDAGGSSCPKEDIWGVVRPSQQACDVGAVEFAGTDAQRPAPPAGVVVE